MSSSSNLGNLSIFSGVQQIGHLFPDVNAQIRWMIVGMYNNNQPRQICSIIATGPIPGTVFTFLLHDGQYFSVIPWNGGGGKYFSTSTEQQLQRCHHQTASDKPLYRRSPFFHRRVWTSRTSIRNGRKNRRRNISRPSPHSTTLTAEDDHRSQG